MKETLRQLFRDVRSQKLRTSLTIFGIVWGTVAGPLRPALGPALCVTRQIQAVRLHAPPR